MNTIARNVILDLLPAYLTGEASKETQELVEAFAQQDAQIARLIRAGAAQDSDMQHISVPDELEMKTMKTIRRSIHRRMLYVALATTAVLMLPLIAMQFTAEVNWSGFDFLFMGSLLLGTGFTYVLISSLSDDLAYRIAIGIAVLTALLLVWVNLAVGMIGSENNPINLLYVGVIAVGIIGAGMARLKPHGMARALFVTASAQMVVPVIALLIGTPALQAPPGIAGIFMLNAFFALLFVVSGMLFHYNAKTLN